jgi:hypothetical protein
VLPNGLIVCLDLALGPRAVETEDARARYAALVLGIFREDVSILPFVGRAFPKLSISHTWPHARRRCASLLASARAARRAGDDVVSAFHLGRAVHVLADLACPVHAHAVWHYLDDPFERWVDAHASELASSVVPELPAPLDTAEALTASLAAAAREERPDATKSPWGRLLKRAGIRETPGGDEVAAQGRRLIPLAAAHVRRLLELAGS